MGGLARGLYEAFWARNGGVSVAWEDQAWAIRNMWEAIAEDASKQLAEEIERERSYAATMANTVAELEIGRKALEAEIASLRRGVAA